MKAEPCMAPPSAEPFTVAFRWLVPHGLLVGVHLPGSPGAVPEEALRRLHPEERRFAEGLHGRELVQFVGGRLAMRSAVEVLGGEPSPVLPDASGAPRMPAGLSGSLSHKGALVVALVDHAHRGSLGVDLEERRRPRVDLGPYVLAEAERAEVEAQPTAWRWLSVLMRFSLKEAVYKALFPRVRRDVDFGEVIVRPAPRGRAEVSLQLERGEGPFSVDARYQWLDGMLISSVRLG